MLSLAAAIIAYLIGSFPTAYVIGKHLRGIDISKNGSGNIGAMNAYDVTDSKMIGIMVGAIDILKGLVVTVFFSATSFTWHNSGLPAIKIGGLTAALFVVLGHNYSIYIKFKGGRGLATAAGAFLVIQPLAVAVFLVVYFTLRFARLKLYLSSVIGILCAVIPVLFKFASIPYAEALLGLLLLVVLSKYIVPLKNELRNAQ